jgi:RNA polymerase sigma factor (sigma-70 family)
LSYQVVANNNDLVAVQKVLAGDVHAYAVLVDHYKDMAVALAYNILLNREDAEEVAQDAFIKAYRSLHSFKATAKFSTWLYRIIVNTALNRKKLKKYNAVVLDSIMENAAMGSIDGHADISKNANKKQIQAALKTLSDNERICITLYYLDELSVEEINEITGITKSNIKVLLYRGRKNLYTSLQRLLKNEITDLI